MIFRLLSIYRIKKLFAEYIYPAIKSKNCKNILRQIYEIIWLAFKTKYWPYNYFKYKGYLKTNSVQKIAKYIPGRLFDAVREDYLNDMNFVNLIEDKYVFNKMLNKAGLPATKVMRHIVRPGINFDYDNYYMDLKQFFLSLKNDFVIKPVIGGAQGSGVNVVEVSNEEGANSFYMQGSILSIEQLIKHLQMYCESELLCEEKIVQHSEISKIYSHSVNTIRIDTLKSKSGDVIIGSALLRVGQHGRLIDNWSGPCGGIAIGVNLETGVLNPIGRDYYMNEFTHHPDSGTEFNGFKIPYFSQVVEIIKYAANVFPNVNSVGWDVAVSQLGPIIIEGNSDYTIQLMQAANGPYYENTAFLQGITSYWKGEKDSVYEKYFGC